MTTLNTGKPNPVRDAVRVAYDAALEAADAATKAVDAARAAYEAAIGNNADLDDADAGYVDAIEAACNYADTTK